MTFYELKEIFGSHFFKTWLINIYIYIYRERERERERERGFFWRGRLPMICASIIHAAS